MSIIVVVCAACGVEFEPDHRAIIAGDWKRCETCRAQRDDGAAPPPAERTSPAVVRVVLERTV